ncbi:MAG: hypothetical protein QW594_03685 [Candidatus Woesearchaeota archaeon]
MHKEIVTHWRQWCSPALIVFIPPQQNDTLDSDITPTTLFFGVGYNPTLSLLGERLDLLNFFFWMKQVQDQRFVEWYIYDASSYAIVNRTPEQKIKQLGEKPTAEQVLEVLINEQDSPKRQEMMDACQLRSQYLRKAIQYFSLRAQYVDAREVFRNDQAYQQALEEALDFVEQLERKNPMLVERILPKKVTAANRLYLPLEIAEARYLQERYGVKGKFGPESEIFFDTAIRALFNEKKIQYQCIRCSCGPRKPGYLADTNVIWTSSQERAIRDLLQNDVTYHSFVELYLAPVRKQEEAVEDAAIRAAKALRLDEVR